MKLKIVTAKNALVGVIYRAYTTSIDDFIHDIDVIYDKITSEYKLSYIVGDFDIDLLKDDVHRPIHDYLDIVYSLQKCTNYSDSNSPAQSSMIQLIAGTLWLIIPSVHSGS